MFPRGLNGERAGIRTRGHLIKSQVLYRLSYTPLIKRQHIDLFVEGQQFFFLFLKFYAVNSDKTDSVASFQVFRTWIFALYAK